MKKLLLVCLVSLFVAGCASNDYALYAKAQSEVEVARHNADAVKFKAMSDIAATGTDSAKVAAVMAIALGQTSAAGKSTMQAPQMSTALQWASILVPSITQIAGVQANMRVAMTQSDNAARVAVSTNEVFTGIAGHIQAPAANVSTTTNTTTDSRNMSTTTDSRNMSVATTTNTATTDSRNMSTTTDSRNMSTTTDSRNMSTTTDNHAVTNPAAIIAPTNTTTTTVKVCTIDPATNAVTCQ